MSFLVEKKLSTKIILISSVSAAVFLALLAGGTVAYQKVYAGRVYPGVFVNEYPLGGLNKAEVVSFVENFNNRFAKEGVDLRVIDKTGQENKIRFNTIAGDDGNAVELAKLDSEQFATMALAVGRQGNLLQKAWLPLWERFFSSVNLSVPVVVNEVLFFDALHGSVGSFEDAPHNATVHLENGAYKAVAEATGKIFDYQAIMKALKHNLGTLSFAPLTIELQDFSPNITKSEVEAFLPQLGVALANDLHLHYEDLQTKASRDWVLTKNMLAGWVDVRKDSEQQLVATLRPDELKKYLETEVQWFVNVSPQDAKFTMTDGKVTEFQGSRSGVLFDEPATIAAITSLFEEQTRGNVETPATTTVAVVTRVAEPKIKTADVNDLGITDIIGVGYSTFHDSHTNRIKNIANAVARLNGTLIKPGEEFSAIKYAGPFTSANGFLPEQVIKGKQIKPEVGGGMCQIGTTLFRMAMNSGMDITERYNHSLVVSYYADPVNHNPGTDATLYEPSLDLKFMNDTGGYLLLQTAIDYQKQQLTFTLWGKPDGRSGSYTHPLVSKWISPPVEPEYITVSDGSVKPGVEKCQAAFRGAVAHFTYTRITPTGEKIERVFDSYYRPLPKICITGCEKGQICTPIGMPSSTFSGVIEPGQ